MSKSNKKGGAGIKTAVALIIATIIITIFLIIAFLLAPRDAIPEFGITDRQGSWEAQGTVAVFDEKIKPGSKGEYYFILKNDSEAVLSYGIMMSEYLSNENHEAKEFMQYRLKMGNKYFGDDEWHSIRDLDYNDIYILPGTKQLMTLEWQWPFEIDDAGNANDTLLGRTNGKLSITFFVWAEVVEEEE